MAKKPAKLRRQVELYEKLVPRIRHRAERRAMRTRPDGHMFSLLTPDGQLALRCQRERRDEFLKKYKTNFEQYGIV